MTDQRSPSGGERPKSDTANVNGDTARQSTNLARIDRSKESYGTLWFAAAIVLITIVVAVLYIKFR